MSFDFEEWIRNRTRLELDLPQHVRAAVLVGLTREASPRVLLTIRSQELKDHTGQIAFPGGKLEPLETVVQAALRETLEEVGLPASQIQVIGLLDDTFTPAGRGFHVTPVLASIPAEFEYVPSSEVAQTLLVPLADLRNMVPERLERVSPWGSVHYIYRYLWQDHDPNQNHVHDIWGMTARVLFGILNPDLERY